MACSLTGVVETKIEEWAQAGEIRVERLQGVLRYRLDDLMRKAAAGGTS